MTRAIGDGTRYPGPCTPCAPNCCVLSCGGGAFRLCAPRDMDPATSRTPNPGTASDVRGARRGAAGEVALERYAQGLRKVWACPRVSYACPDTVEGRLRGPLTSTFVLKKGWRWRESNPLRWFRVRAGQRHKTVAELRERLTVADQSRPKTTVVLCRTRVRRVAHVSRLYSENGHESPCEHDAAVHFHDMARY